MQKTNFPFEAIVHDDASTDGTAKIILEYAKKYPDIIKPIFEIENQYSKKDGSLGRILNHACNGSYIAVCEGDDYWTDPLKLQKQVDFLEKNPDFSMCSHDFFTYKEDAGELSDESCFRSLFQSKGRQNSYIKYGVEDNFLRWYTQPLTVMYRNGAYLSRIPAEKYRYYRDNIFYYYVLLQGMGALLPDVMGVYRKQPGGIYSGISELERWRISRDNMIAIFSVEKDCRALVNIASVEFLYIHEIYKQNGIIDSSKEIISFFRKVPFNFFCLFMRILLKNFLKHFLIKTHLLK